jgi:asparagine synthase (glutamine-hydrolysing)
MSMAASIESRVPFLDHPLVEWAAQLSPDVKLHDRRGKSLVRLAAERLLPRRITHAPKRGFSLPLGSWLRQHGTRTFAEYLPQRGDDLLSVPYVDRLIREHLAGRDHTARLWRVLAFQVWRREALGAYSTAPLATEPVVRC